MPCENKDVSDPQFDDLVFQPVAASDRHGSQGLAFPYLLRVLKIYCR